jgi:hypothetical protein
LTRRQLALGLLSRTHGSYYSVREGGPFADTFLSAAARVSAAGNHALWLMAGKIMTAEK